MLLKRNKQKLSFLRREYTKKLLTYFYTKVCRKFYCLFFEYRNFFQGPKILPFPVLIWRKMSLESWSRACVEYTRVVTLTNRQIPIYKIQPDERNSPVSTKIVSNIQTLLFFNFSFPICSGCFRFKNCFNRCFFVMLTSAIMKYFTISLVKNILQLVLSARFPLSCLFNVIRTFE